jgi:hypothetical protein
MSYMKPQCPASRLEQQTRHASGNRQYLEQNTDRDQDATVHSFPQKETTQPLAPTYIPPEEVQPSVEHYIRTAEGMCDYLACDSMDSWQLWEWPPWDTLDPQNGAVQHPRGSG